MRKTLMAVAAAAALGTFGLTAPASAQTQTAPVEELIAAIKRGEVQTDYVQARRHVRGDELSHRRRYVRPPYRYGRSYYGRPYRYARPHRYYRRDRGNSLAAGALGLATGAIIGGALAQQQRAPVYVAPNQSAVAYCSQRFRSYDPASGTYLGYDGRRHACP